MTTKLGKLRNKDAYMRSKWDWDFLVEAGCFGGERTKIAPSDVDAAVHVGNRDGNGDYILLIETKNPFENLPIGQQIMLEGFVRIGKGDIDVLVIYGEAKEQKIRKLSVCNYDETKPKRVAWTIVDGADREKLINICRSWYIASKQKLQLRKENGNMKSEVMIDLGYNIKGAIVDVSPEVATQWLDKNITNNRRPKAAKIAAFAGDMSSGYWTLTGEAIKFDIHGRLLDGQNRLAACVQAGKVLRTLVLWGVTKPALLSMDSGTKRTGADALKVSNTVESSQNEIAAAAGYLARYRSDKLHSHGMSISNQEIVKLVKKNGGLTEKSLKVGGKAGPIIRSKGMGIFLHYVFHEHYPKKADEFFSKLADGTGFMYKDDPVYRLREKLLSEQGSGVTMHRITKLAYIIKAWNAFVNNEKIQKLVWIRDRHKFPKIK